MNVESLAKRVALIEQKNTQNKKVAKSSSLTFASVNVGGALGALSHFFLHILSACIVGYVLYFHIFLHFFAQNKVIFALLLIVLVASALYSALLDMSDRK